LAAPHYSSVSKKTTLPARLRPRDITSSSWCQMRLANTPGSLKRSSPIPTKTGETTLAFASNELADSNLPRGFRRNDPAKSPVGVEIAFLTECWSRRTRSWSERTDSVVRRAKLTGFLYRVAIMSSCRAVVDAQGFFISLRLRPSPSPAPLTPPL